MKKIYFLSLSLLLTSSIFPNNSIFKHGKDTSLQEQLTYGKFFCELNTQGKYPAYSILKPIEKELRTFLCGTISEKTNNPKLVDNFIDLKNLTPLRQLGDFSGIYKKSNVKYEGWRDEAPIGKIIEKMILNPRHYKGRIISDEYKKLDTPVFMWTLKNNNELKAIASYLLKELKENKDEKPLLVLNLIEDPKLEALDDLDKQFLSEYFELVDPTNKDVKEYLTNMKTLFFDIKSNIGSCKKYIDENLQEGIIRELEKFFEDFKIQDNIGKLIISFFLFDIYNHGKVTKFMFSKMLEIKNLFIEPSPKKPSKLDEINNNLNEIKNMFQTNLNNE